MVLYLPLIFYKNYVGKRENESGCVLRGPAHLLTLRESSRQSRRNPVLFNFLVNVFDDNKNDDDGNEENHILYRFRVGDDIKCDDIVFKYDDFQAKVDREAFYHSKNKALITTPRVHIT